MRVLDLALTPPRRRYHAELAPLALLAAFPNHQRNRLVARLVRPALHHEQPLAVATHRHVVDLPRAAHLVRLRLADLLLAGSDDRRAHVLLHVVALDVSHGGSRAHQHLVRAVVEQNACAHVGGQRAALRHLGITRHLLAHRRQRQSRDLALHHALRGLDPPDAVVATAGEDARAVLTDGEGADRRRHTGNEVGLLALQPPQHHDALLARREELAREGREDDVAEEVGVPMERRRHPLCVSGCVWRYGREDFANAGFGGGLRGG